MIFHRRFFASVLLGLIFFGNDLAIGAESNGTPISFQEFDAWWQQFIAVNAAERTAMIKNGTALAKTRSSAMVEMIEKQPEQAIERAFAEEFHSALPEPIQELVETHKRGLAKMTVTEKDRSASRKVELNGETLKGYLSGARLKLDSREEIPIHGIELFGKIAVNASPLERFPKRESLIEVLRQGEGKKSCPICGEPGLIPTAVGDVLLWFDTEEHLLICEKAVIEKEMSPEEAE